MAKSDRIVIRLEPDARAALHAKAAALGLDDAAFVRMLIYRDANNATAPQAPVRLAMGVARRAEPVVERDADDPRGPYPAEPIDDGSLGERADDFEVPADADGGAPSAALEDLLAAGPSLLDDLLSAAQPRDPAAAPLMSTSATRRGYEAPQAKPGPALPGYGPGSRTRAVGVNDQAIGSNAFGDGRGNVLRDNMRHFSRR